MQEGKCISLDGGALSDMHRVPCGGLHSLKGKACSRRPWSRRLMLRARLRSSNIYPQTSGGHGEPARSATRRSSSLCSLKPVGSRYAATSSPWAYHLADPRSSRLGGLSGLPVFDRLALTPWAARGLLRWSQDALWRRRLSFRGQPSSGSRRKPGSSGDSGGQQRQLSALSRPPASNSSPRMAEVLAYD